jgi:uncharacterized protein YndB with AHSA1/START domain
MNDPSVVHSTFVIERRLAAPAGRVFAALSDPAQVRRWYAEGDGRSAEVFEMDFSIRGRQHMGSRMGEETPFPGALLESDAVFLDIEPDQRLVMAQTMSLAGRRISASLITYEILESGEGAELVFTHQGAFFEGSGGPEMREEGWRHLLEGLAQALAS